MKKKTLTVVLIFLFVNAAGYLLRYFELDTYIIIIGFRFHFSLLLPFIFIAGYIKSGFLKNIFVEYESKSVWSIILLICFPLAIVPGVLFLFGEIDLGDPEYFYEFGLSSIPDFPVYLLWNAPQLIMLYLFIRRVIGNQGSELTKIFIVIILLFAYEFIPLPEKKYDFVQLADFILAAAAFTLLLTRIRNVYWFCVTGFTTLWLNLLIFGSNSKLLINILFASQYEYWEGFVTVSSFLTRYTFPMYMLIFILTIILLNHFSKRSNNLSAGK